MAVKLAESPTSSVISTQLPGETSALRPSPQIEVPTVTSFDASVSKTPTFKGSAPIHSDTSTVQTAPFPAAIPTPMYPPQSSERADSPMPMNSHLPNHVELGSENHAIPSEDISHSDTSTVQTAPFPAAIPTPMYPPQSSEKADSPLPMNSHLPNHVELGSENHAIPSEDISSRVQLDEIPVTYDNIEIVEEARPERKASEDEKPITELVVEEGEVPLSDAPLIGAPFRLLGFMARYVSGADLVKPKKSSG